MFFDDGTILDAMDPSSWKVFKTTPKDIMNKIKLFSKSVKVDKAMREKIRDKFTIKNTTGYSVNVFIGSDDSIDIIMRLMVGPEGTLDFISKVTLRSIEDEQLKRFEPIEFTLVNLAPDLTFHKITKTVAIHATCSA